MFRIRVESDKWFKKLKSSEKKLFKTKFDLYYLFFLNGIAHEDKNPQLSGNGGTSEIIDYFPSDYSGSKHLIVGLLVVTELKRLGVSFNDKPSVEEKFQELVDPESKSKLTTKGFSKMNDYANKGFELLQEEIGNQTELAPEFLVNTYESLKRSFDG